MRDEAGDEIRASCLILLKNHDERKRNLMDENAPVGPENAKRLLLDMNGYQWTVLFAAWLGWGFDIFDGLLFNYVAPNCVPTLLHISNWLAAGPRPSPCNGQGS